MVYSVKLITLTGGFAVEDSRLMQSTLLDFYGELLTEKQRECCDLHFNEDLSLSEIAEHSGISRQAVWDNIRRAEAAMKDMEEKTGLIRRLSETRQLLDSLEERLGRLEGLCQGEALQLVRQARHELQSHNSRG